MQREGIINTHRSELKKTAERFAKQMGAQFDVNLNFSVDSLRRLDGMLEQMIDLSEVYWSERQEELLPVALALTAYVGEVFLRAFEGSEWVTETEEDGVPPPHIRLPHGIRLNLMKKSIEVLAREDSPSFASYYQTVADVVRNQGTESR